MRACRGRAQPGVRGVTLVEWLTVVAVMAVGWAVAAPHLKHWRQDWALTQATNGWLALLHRARVDAIASGRPVMLCATSPISAPCAPGTGWNHGYTLFVDTNRNGWLDPADVVLWQGNLPGRVRLSGNTPVSRYVRYHPDGQPRLTSGAFQAGTFTLCMAGETDPRYFRHIVMSAPGRVRIERPTTAQPACQ